MASFVRLPVPHDDFVDLVQSSFAQVGLQVELNKLGVTLSPGQTSIMAKHAIAGRFSELRTFVSSAFPSSNLPAAKLDSVFQGVKSEADQLGGRIHGAINSGGGELRKIADEIHKAGKADEEKLAKGLSNLYRSFASYVLQTSVVPPFEVQGANPSIRLSPTSVKYSTQVSVAPSLAALTPMGVLGFLTSLFKLQVTVEVDYSAPTAGGK